MNSKQCFDECFERNCSLIMLTCGLPAVSYQVKKQYMKNVIRYGATKKFGFIDESQAW